MLFDSQLIPLQPELPIHAWGMEPTLGFEPRTCCLRIARTDTPGAHLGAFARPVGAHVPVSGRDRRSSLPSMPHDGPVALLRLALIGVSSGVTGDGMAISNGR